MTAPLTLRLMLAATAVWLAAAVAVLLAAASLPGKTIAYGLSHLTGVSDIYLLDVGTARQLRLPLDAHYVAEPSWSPDGQRLALSSMSDGNGNIFTVAFDGRGLTRVTDDLREEWTPSWSPDGRRIAFQMRRDGDWHVFVLDLVSGERLQYTQLGGFNVRPMWSPDGRQIAFVSDRSGTLKIYVMSADCREPNNLCDLHAERLIDGSGWEYAPSWSPDGGRIAFTGREAESTEIFTARVDGTDIRRLTYNNTSDYAPTWSPDGRQIAFVSNRSGAYELFVMNADGTEPRRLTYDAKDITSPAWQP